MPAETPLDVELALGQAVTQAIDNWVSCRSKDGAGPITFFEHPSWGTFLLTVEPSLKMSHAHFLAARRAEALEHKRAAARPCAPLALELPPAAELLAITKAR